MHPAGALVVVEKELVFLRTRSTKLLGLRRAFLFGTGVPKWGRKAAIVSGTLFGVPAIVDRIVGRAVLAKGGMGGVSGA